MRDYSPPPKSAVRRRSQGQVPRFVDGTRRNTILDGYTYVRDFDEGEMSAARIEAPYLSMEPYGYLLQVSKSFTDEMYDAFLALMRSKKTKSPPWFDHLTAFDSPDHSQVVVDDGPVTRRLLERAEFRFLGDPKNIMTTLLNLPEWFRKCLQKSFEEGFPKNRYYLNGGDEETEAICTRAKTTEE
ncbi:hypothetical protein AA313_de0203256 [Arthrobotrys entomopaga]|nr:hypothetical protein AA313_de0203256 [Arthrobotrys entomopaga]